MSIFLCKSKRYGLKSLLRVFVVGRVFDCKKHSNVKRRACYRRIGGGRYYKGLAKYKSEKYRRKQVLELQKQGRCVTEVAGLLGVSRRTIYRDLEKLRSCTQAEVNRFRWDNTDYLTLDMKDLVKRVERFRDVVRKVRVRGQVRVLTVRVDVDAAFEGRSAVRFVPRLPVNVSSGGKIVFELNVGGHVFEVACLYVVVPSHGRFLLETNLCRGPAANPPLELQVVDCGNPGVVCDDALIRGLGQIQRRMFCWENPWRMAEFLALAPQLQDVLLERFRELCGEQGRFRVVKQFTVTLNVEEALNSVYSVHFKPRLPVELSECGKIILKLQASNKTQHLITLQVSGIEYNLARLGCKQLRRKLKINGLKGLKIVGKCRVYLD